MQDWIQRTVKGNTKYRKHLGVSGPPPSSHKVPTTINYDPGTLATNGRPEVKCWPKLRSSPKKNKVWTWFQFLSGYPPDCGKCQLAGSAVIMLNHMHSEASRTSLREKEGVKCIERQSQDAGLGSWRAPSFWFQFLMQSGIDKCRIIEGPSLKRENTYSEMWVFLKKRVRLVSIFWDLRVICVFKYCAVPISVLIKKQIYDQVNSK